MVLRDQRGKAARAAAVACIGLIVSSCSVLSGESAQKSRVQVVTEAVTGISINVVEARLTLGRIPTKGRAPKTGYSRDKFGQKWADIDKNGCDQRNDVLGRDLSMVVRKPGSDCVVQSGILADLYTGHMIAFERGRETSSAVQIDHVVALSDAWQKGAQQLPEKTRERLANDPDNLIAVDGPTNRKKSDGDAATWLPPDRSSWCDYAARQIMIKDRYGVWVTAPERAALERVLDGCPALPSPRAGPDSAPARNTDG